MKMSNENENLHFTHRKNTNFDEFQISFVNRKVVLLDDEMLHLDPIIFFSIQIIARVSWRAHEYGH